MSCCNTITPINLGCFNCKSTIFAQEATIAGEHQFALSFRGGLLEETATFNVGDNINLNEVFDIDFVAPYEYEVLMTDPSGDKQKFCFTMKPLIKC